jgi:hypothetical protein
MLADIRNEERTGKRPAESDASMLFRGDGLHHLIKKQCRENLSFPIAPEKPSLKSQQGFSSCKLCFTLQNNISQES